MLEVHHECLKQQIAAGAPHTANGILTVVSVYENP